MLRFIALMLLALPVYADVIVTATNFSGDTFDMTVTGDPVPVTITAAGGIVFDQWKTPDLNGTEIITSPRLEVTNNVGRFDTITVTGPVSGLVEIDGGTENFSGGTITVDGVTAPFVRSSVSVTYIATVQTGGVVVPPPPVGTATLTWTPPTENVDGSPLTDLAGYKFYWGTQSGVHPNSETLNDPTATAHTLELAEGSYFFVATAFDQSGNESAPSNEVFGSLGPGPGPPVDLGFLELPAEGFTVKAEDTQAYNIRKIRGAVVMVAVGTVAVGSPCSDAVAVKDEADAVYWVLPESVEVDWFGLVRPSVVFGRCP